MNVPSITVKCNFCSAVIPAPGAVGASRMPTSPIGVFLVDITNGSAGFYRATSVNSAGIESQL